jgi:hypothetical protein
LIFNQDNLEFIEDISFGKSTKSRKINKKPRNQRLIQAVAEDAAARRYRRSMSTATPLLSR